MNKLLITDGKTDLLSQRLTDQSPEARTVSVYNVSSKASEDNLQAFFGYCGKIKELKQQYDRVKNEFCWAVEFERAEAARTACMLNKTALLGSDILITSRVHDVDALTALAKQVQNPVPPPAPKSDPKAPLAIMGPSSSPASSIQQPPTSPVPVSPVTPTPPQIDIGALLTNLLADPAQNAHMLIAQLTTLGDSQALQAAANLNALLILQLGYDPHNPPDYLVPPPLCKPEELHKTVYVSGLPPQVSSEHLVRHFSACGPVAYHRIAGTDLSKFAFVEFLEIGGSLAAMSLNGTALGGRIIKVAKAFNCIAKHVKEPTPPPSLPAEVKVDKKKRSKSRSRSRGRHNRKRSRERSRRRSRSRKHSHHRKDRSHSRDRHKDKHRSNQSDRGKTSDSKDVPKQRHDDSNHHRDRRSSPSKTADSETKQRTAGNHKTQEPGEGTPVDVEKLSVDVTTSQIDKGTLQQNVPLPDTSAENSSRNNPDSSNTCGHHNNHNKQKDINTKISNYVSEYEKDSTTCRKADVRRNTEDKDTCSTKSSITREKETHDRFPNNTKDVRSSTIHTSRDFSRDRYPEMTDIPPDTKVKNPRLDLQRNVESGGASHRHASRNYRRHDSLQEEIYPELQKLETDRSNSYVDGTRRTSESCAYVKRSRETEDRTSSRRYSAYSESDRNRHESNYLREAEYDRYDIPESRNKNNCGGKKARTDSIHFSRSDSDEVILID